MSKINKVVSVMASVVLASCMCQTTELNVSAIEYSAYNSLMSITTEDLVKIQNRKVVKEAKVIKSEAKTRRYDSSLYGVGDITGATEDELNELIDRIIDHRGLSYCPFKGKGDTLKEIEEIYEINPVALLAIWTWESSFGTSNMASNRNNYGGIKGSDGYKYFDTVSDGMTEQGRLLRENYLDQGYTTYSDIASKYCPGNTSWADNVSGSAQLYAGWLEDIVA